VIVADGAWGAEGIERFIAAHGVDRRRGSDAGDESGG
jgi:hypothetical protein